MLNLIDLTIVDQEMQAILTLPNLLHLAAEQVTAGDSAEIQLTIRLGLNLSEVVIATHPDGVIRVTVDNRHAGDFRRMDDAPFSLVIIQDTLEVGHIDDAVFRHDDIEVTVMGFVIFGIVITQERYSLSSHKAGVQHQHAKEQQSLHGCTSFPDDDRNDS